MVYNTQNYWDFGLRPRLSIHQADKGNFIVVLDESKYKDKLNTSTESGA
jgi:hypothetical protein